MKSQHFSHSKWLIFLPVALFALFAPSRADASQIGLIVRGYQIDQIPPTKSDIAYPSCGDSVEPFINANWDWESFGDCGGDSFMLHYQGFIQIPEHQTIEFFVASDDGGTIKIGTDEFGVWQDQGCSATWSGELDVAAGTQSLDGWFYENGGNTCYMLAWNIDGQGWEIVQPEYFTSEPLTPSTTTTEADTTTTEMPTSTTATTSTTFLPITTEQQQTTTTSTTFLPTTTEQQQTTTTIQETTSPTHPIPAMPDTPLPESTTTSLLPTVLEPPTTDISTFPQTTSLPAVTTTSLPDPSTSLPESLETITSTIATSTTFLQPEAVMSNEQFAEVLTSLSTATAEEIAAIITEVLSANLSSDQAEQLVASPEILSAITGEQAATLFAQVEETQLSEAMASVIADALNQPDVPTEVKEAFESQINIFGNNGFANYIPVDSVVSVAVRRTIIAGTTILVALPSPVSTRRK